MSTAPVKRKKLLICGFWEGNRNLAPYADQSFDVWGLNHLWKWIPADRWDRWFDMHSPEWSSKNLVPVVWAEQEAFFKAQHGKPIYMLEKYEGFPDAVAYPKAEVSAKFRRYFTNGIAYMIALALFEGHYEEIQLWGVDMRHNEEYALQRPCTEYWLGIAEGMGVKVVIPPQAAILSADHDYGYEEAGGLPSEAIRAHQEVLAKAIEQKNMALAQAQTYDGVIQDNQEWIRRWDQKTRGHPVISVVFRSQEGIYPPGRPFPFEDHRAAHFISTGRALPATAADAAAVPGPPEQFVDPAVEVLNDPPAAGAVRREKWKNRQARDFPKK